MTADFDVRCEKRKPCKPSAEVMKLDRVCEKGRSLRGSVHVKCFAMPDADGRATLMSVRESKHRSVCRLEKMCAQ